MLKYSPLYYPITSNVTDDELIQFCWHSLEKKFKMPIQSCILLKKSIDARDIPQYVLQVAFTLKQSRYEQLLIKRYSKVELYQPFQLEIPQFNSDKHYLVVGMGPAGLFHTLILAQAGAKVTLIERGKTVEERVNDVNTFFHTGKLNPTSNIQFGEGGAGTFSDGKLNTGNTVPLSRYVLETFVRFGAPKDILYEAKPHIGTDILRKVLINIRYYLIELGVNIYFETKLTMLQTHSQGVKATFEGKIESGIYDGVILAIGHSAQDTYQMLETIGITLKPKSFAIGVRIEHLQENINDALYHQAKRYLPPATYKLVAHPSCQRAVYSFCMCPGGHVVNASSEEGHLVVNGMSNRLRDATNANAAILVEVRPEDYYCSSALDGLNYQRHFEQLAYQKGYLAPVQRWEDFKLNRQTKALGLVSPSILPGYYFANLRTIFPKWLNDALIEAMEDFGKKIVGFDDHDAILTGVETRSSSPIQVTRNECFVSSMEGVYPIGEGAGYAGGIMTSAIDGIKCALKMIEEEKHSGK